MEHVQGTVTLLLAKASAGDSEALSDLIQRVYSDVHRLSAAAHVKDGAGRYDMMLQPTLITDDVLMRLACQWKQARDSGQFFALATRFIHQRIADAARARNTQKRGKGWHDLGEVDVPDQRQAEDQYEQIEALVIALNKLEKANPRRAEVVVLHTVGEKSLPEIAKLLDVSLSTVERDWRKGRAWVAEEIG